MCAMKTCGAAAMRANAAWLVRIIAMLASTSPSRNFLTSAPAEKNRSPADRTTTARTSLGERVVDGAGERGHQLEVVGVRRRVVERDRADGALGLERDRHQATPPTTTDFSST